MVLETILAGFLAGRPACKSVACEVACDRSDQGDTDGISVAQRSGYRGSRSERLVKVRQCGAAPPGKEEIGLGV